MLNETLYKEIMKRKSTRIYDLKDKNINIKEIEEYMKNIKPLDDSIKIDLRIIESNKINRKFMKEAPYYIAAFSEIKENYLLNIGFILEQIDLFLSSKNIASCWQGVPQPKDELKKSSTLEFIIFLAFGNTKEKVHRQGINEFKRKDLTEIKNINGESTILETAHFAPSSRNSQPWFFSGSYNSIDVFCKNPTRIDKMMNMDFFNQIDMGIILLILSLSILHENKEFTIDLREDKSKKLKKYYYIANITIE